MSTVHPLPPSHVCSVRAWVCSFERARMCTHRHLHACTCKHYTGEVTCRGRGGVLEQTGLSSCTHTGAVYLGVRQTSSPAHTHTHTCTWGLDRHPLLLTQVGHGLRAQDHRHLHLHTHTCTWGLDRHLHLHTHTCTWGLDRHLHLHTHTHTHVPGD